MALIHLTVNHRVYFVDVAENTTLLEVLRTKLRLGNTQQACSLGVCGSCTVMLNGIPRQVCMVRAVDANRAVIDTMNNFAHDSSKPALAVDCIGLCKVL